MLQATTPLADVFGAAIKGDRKDQQDSFRSIWLSGERAWLLLVADGMGGHAAGGVASTVAVDIFASSFIAERGNSTAIDKALPAALDAANARLHKIQQNSPDLHGMGTTLLAVYLSPDQLAWISVGDSPLWMLRNGRMRRLNEDHSLRSVVAEGNHVRGNLLISALNGQPLGEVDCQIQSNALSPGDTLVLGSDGILTLEEDDIASIVAALPAETDAETTARRLLENIEQRAKPRQDNCTVVIATYRSVNSPARSYVRTDKRIWLLTAVIAAASAFFWFWTI